MTGRTCVHQRVRSAGLGERRSFGSDPHGHPTQCSLFVAADLGSSRYSTIPKNRPQSSTISTERRKLQESVLRIPLRICEPPARGLRVRVAPFSSVSALAKGLLFAQPRAMASLLDTRPPDVLYPPACGRVGLTGPGRAFTIPGYEKQTRGSQCAPPGRYRVRPPRRGGEDVGR